VVGAGGSSSAAARAAATMAAARTSNRPSCAVSSRSEGSAFKFWNFLWSHAVTVSFTAHVHRRTFPRQRRGALPVTSSLHQLARTSLF
jgi:hypothetical protein